MVNEDVGSNPESDHPVGRNILCKNVNRCSKVHIFVLLVVLCSFSFYLLGSWYPLLAISTAPWSERNVRNETMKAPDIDTQNLGAKFPTSSSNKSLFSRVIGEFEWETFMNQVKQKNNSSVDSYQGKLIQLLQDFVVVEPKVQIRPECQPPRLAPVTQEICSSDVYGNAFTGNVNSNPPKVGILVQFGFHVDELEIYLNEVYDVVDRFFIAESTSTHIRTLRKALIWDKIKYQKRFLKFSDKVVHILVDDTESSEEQHKKIVSPEAHPKISFDMEITQERFRWTKFLQWNDHHKYFGDSDLLGFGDADEIPARRTIHLLKHCSLKSSVLDVGTWFPFGNFEYAFQSDWPVPDHPYTLGDPTFFTLQAAKKYSHDFQGMAGRNYPTRQRGKSASYILGGVHMTASAYLPFELVKMFSCSECVISWGMDLRRFEKIAARIRADELTELEAELRTNLTVGSLKSRIRLLKDLGEEMKEIAILPWFYSCNKDRYPVWEGKHDNRLE